MSPRALPQRPRRVESAQHANRILTLAPRHRGVLPRWGINSPIRSRPPEPGAHSGTIGWTTREHWLGVVVPIVIATRRDVLRRHEISPDTFRRWAAVKSLYAQDRRCGRTVIVRPDTVAGVMGVSKGHVQKCNRAARELGLEKVIQTGRMLSELETYAARRRGSPQRGLSTVSAFIMPWAVKMSVFTDTPTSGRFLGSSVREFSTFKNRSAGSTGAPLRSAPQRRRRGPGWDLAVGLVNQAIFLHRCPPGRIAGQLSRFASAEHRWTSTQVLRAMDRVNVRLGYTAPVHVKTTPWGLLAWYLAQIDPWADHPEAGRNIRATV